MSAKVLPPPTKHVACPRHHGGSSSSSSSSHQSSSSERATHCTVFFLATLSRCTLSLHILKKRPLCCTPTSPNLKKGGDRERGRASTAPTRAHTPFCTLFSFFLISTMHSAKEKKFNDSSTGRGTSSPVPVCNTVPMAERWRRKRRRSNRQKNPVTDNFFCFLLPLQDSRKKGMKMGRGWMIVTTIAKACTHTQVHPRSSAIPTAVTCSPHVEI